MTFRNLIIHAQRPMEEEKISLFELIELSNKNQIADFLNKVCNPFGKGNPWFVENKKDQFVISFSGPALDQTSRSEVYSEEFKNSKEKMKGKYILERLNIDSLPTAKADDLTMEVKQKFRKHLIVSQDGFHYIKDTFYLLQLFTVATQRNPSKTKCVESYFTGVTWKEPSSQVSISTLSFLTKQKPKQNENQPAELLPNKSNIAMPVILHKDVSNNDKKKDIVDNVSNIGDQIIASCCPYKRTAK